MEEMKKKLEEKKQQKGNLRMSSIPSYNYKKGLNASLNIKKSIDDIGEKINEENENENEIENEEKNKNNEQEEQNDNDIFSNIKEVDEKKINPNDNKDNNNNFLDNIEEKEEKEEKETKNENNEKLENNENNKNLQIEGSEEKKSEEKKEKEKIDDEDIDLEGNLNINEQMEITANNIKEEPKEKKQEKVEETFKIIDLNLKKAQSEQKVNNLSKSVRFYSVIQREIDNIYETAEEDSPNTVKTTKETPEKEKHKNKEEDYEEKKEEDEEENYLEEDENIEKEIVIKDELYQEYKNNLFDKFLVWSLGINVEITFESINLSSMPIANLNILEIIFVLDKEVNDINLTIKFFESIDKLINTNLTQNSYNLLINKKIYSLFLDTTFKFFHKKEKIENKVYELGKKILLNLFINSFLHVEKNHIDKYPCYEIDSIFLWGEQFLKSNKYYNIVFEFLNELLLEFMIQFKTKFENKMNFKINADIKSNFYLKNYFIMLTQLFRFSFHFQNNSTDINDINLKTKMLDKYTYSMHLELSKNRINEMWVNFPFFDDIYKRLSYLWEKDNIFKKYKISNSKGNKLLKYEDILNKIILDKNYKNVHQNELTLLTYEEKNKESNMESIIPLIRTIPITLMCIITILSKKQNSEKELLHWLKQFKKFIRFIIISSTNLTRVNQLDFYNYIQDKCIGPIVAAICFLKDMSKTSLICKDKIQKNLHSLLLFCFIITKYQYKYIIKHKSGIKMFNIITKPARNDLKLSAVFLLFTEYIKDKTGNSILPLAKLDQYSVNQYINITNLLDNLEWNEYFFMNQNIKNKLIKEFFTFVNFQKEKDMRSVLMKEMNDDKDEKYTEEILDLLPLYERELSKYSNNSLENTIQKKNRYKAIKKKSFSWRGFWSDRKLFFENVDQLKLKLINHYTKTFMKPLLAPILDIEYYLPEFSGFKIDSLFLNSNETPNGFKLTMDIDKILKLSEQNQIAMNNIKESFGEKKAKVRENYLRKIYLKSNKELAESLKNITNNLDLGKEEEFTNVDHSSSTGETNKSTLSKTKTIKKKYFLSCLVKTSHHIKGVCFIYENQLNFRVFLNQRTGNFMSGVELAFTNKDDDYDQDRQTCFGSYFVCHPKDKDLYQITIDYNDIKWMFRRRYYYKNSAIEIFTSTNKSFYFNFKYEKDRETVIEEITSKIKEVSKIYDDIKDPKDSFDNIIGFENADAIHSKKKTKKTK